MGIKSNNKSESYYNYFGDSGKDAVGAFTGPKVTASGGTTVDGGGYKYHVFVSPGNFVVSAAGNVEALIVAGGGGTRSDWAGGGGAGGIAHAQNWPMTPGTYAVVAGDAGAATGWSSPGPGAPSKGQDSTFNGITALGGGAGMQDAYQGNNPAPEALMNGGSGGGNGDEGVGPTTAAGTGTQPTQPTHSGLVTNYGNPGYGPAGGNTWPATTQNNGGGGGAGGGGPATSTGPDGGAGQPFPGFPGPVLAPAIPAPVRPSWGPIVGPTGVFGGGGGASGDGSGSGGDPGPGGGGKGGPTGFKGLDYTGGGGGGKNGSPNGGYEGGKGVVIVRYQV